MSRLRTFIHRLRASERLRPRYLLRAIARLLWWCIHRGARQLALLILAGLLAVLGLIGMGFTESGTRMLAGAADLIPALTLGEVEGRLWGNLRVHQMQIDLPDLRLTLAGVRLDWQRRLQIGVDDIQFRRTGSSEPKPRLPGLPRLALPLATAIDFELGRLRFEETTLFSRFTGYFESDGLHHTLRIEALDTPVFHAQGIAQLEGDAPFPLRGTINLQGTQDILAWQGQLTLDGTLERLRLIGSGRAASSTTSQRKGGVESSANSRTKRSVAHGANGSTDPGKDAGKKNLSKKKTPLAHSRQFQAQLDWEIAPMTHNLFDLVRRADTRVEALNLRAFWPQAPETALRIQIQSQGTPTFRDTPEQAPTQANEAPATAHTETENLAIQLALDNTLPGRLTAGRLPLRQLRSTLRLFPTGLTLENLTLDSLSGRLETRGKLDTRQLALDTTLSNFRLDDWGVRLPASEPAGGKTASPENTGSLHLAPPVRQIPAVDATLHIAGPWQQVDASGRMRWKTATYGPGTLAFALRYNRLPWEKVRQQPMPLPPGGHDTPPGPANPFASDLPSPIPHRAPSPKAQAILLREEPGRPSPLSERARTAYQALRQPTPAAGASATNKPGANKSTAAAPPGGRAGTTPAVSADTLEIALVLEGAKGSLQLAQVLGFDQGLPLASALRFDDFDPQTLAPLLAASGWEVPNGRLRGESQFALLAQADAGAHRGHLSLLLRDSLLNGHPLRAQVEARWEQWQIALPTLELVLGDSRLSGSGHWGQLGDRLNLDVRHIDLQRMGIHWSGQIDGQLALTGSWEQPGLEGQLRVAQLAIPGGIALESLVLDTRAQTQSAQGRSQPPQNPAQGKSKGKAQTLGRQAAAPARPKHASPRPAPGGTKPAHEKPGDTLETRLSRLDGPLQDAQFAVWLTLRNGSWQDLQLHTLQLRITGKPEAHEGELQLEGGWQQQAFETRLSFEGVYAREGSAATRGNGTGWYGRLLSLESSGRWPAHLHQAAGISWQAQRLQLEQIDLTLLNSRLTLHTLKWEPGQQLVAQGTLHALALGEWFERIPSLARAMQTDLILRSEFDLSLRPGESPTGHVRFERLGGDLSLLPSNPALPPYPLKLTRAGAELTCAQQRCQLGLGLQGARGQMNGKARLSLKQDALEKTWTLDTETPFAGEMAVDLNTLHWIDPLVENNFSFDGKINYQLTLGGTLAQPKWKGSFTARQVEITQADMGVAWKNGQLDGTLDGHQLHVDALRLESGEGWMEGSGKAQWSLPPANSTEAEQDIWKYVLAHAHAQMDLRFQKFAALAHPQHNIITNGNIQLRWQDAWLDIQGNWKIEQGLLVMAQAGPNQRVTQTLGDDVAVHKVLPGTAENAAPDALDESKPLPDPFSLRVDLQLETTGPFRWRGVGVDAQLQGHLRLSYRPATQLALVGTLNTENGRYNGYGRDLLITRGQVTFQGPLTNPALDISAERLGLPIQVGVKVTGTAQRPRLALFSNQVMPDNEKFAWLILGHSSESLSVADANLLLVSAQALFGNEGGSSLEQYLEKVGITDLRFGKSSLSAPPTPGTNNTHDIPPPTPVDPTQNLQTGQILGSSDLTHPNSTSGNSSVVVGKKLSDKLYLSYEQEINVENYQVKLTYKFNDALSFSVSSGDNNSGAYFSYSWLLGGTADLALPFITPPTPLPAPRPPYRMPAFPPPQSPPPMEAGTAATGEGTP